MKINSATNYNLKKNPMSYNKSFKGHLGVEHCAEVSLKKLIKETAFFRNYQTKQFVKSHILNAFKNSEAIKILVGACSTGEEAYTYSMMLSDIKKKISILGFDISQKSIDRANSKKFIMQTPITQNSAFIKNLMSAYDAFKDSFLCLDAKSLPPEKFEQKFLFDNFFEITDSKNTTEKKGVLDLIKENFKNIFEKKNKIKFDYKIAKLKKDIEDNCHFIQGDIMDLNKITQGERFDVITFSNALYHLTNKEIENTNVRYLRSDTEDIIKKIAQDVKNSLNPNGIFVLGENEELQSLDSTTIPRVFQELGFEPLNKTLKHDANVWLKI